MRPTVTKRKFFLGLDLGQRRDRTARISKPERDPVTWQPVASTRSRVSYLQRMPLHTPHTTIAEHVTRIGRTLSSMGQCTLVDATGVGLPVVDALKIVNAPWRLMPVTIGSAAHEHYSDGFWRVPKRDLIANLQLAFENHAFRIASPGTAHDDLAIALAWWAAHTRRPGELGINKPLI